MTHRMVQPILATLMEPARGPEGIRERHAGM
jgi:hypothetical protein